MAFVIVAGDVEVAVEVRGIGGGVVGVGWRAVVFVEVVLGTCVRKRVFDQKFRSKRLEIRLKINLTKTQPNKPTYHL